MHAKPQPPAHAASAPATDEAAATDNATGNAGPTAASGPSTFSIYRDGGTTAEIRLTVMLVLVARRWRALLDERLRPMEQSSARMEAMAAIVNLPEPRAQVDVARRLRIEGPTITRMIDALSADGLVERRQSPTDRRTNFLSLTDDGTDALAAIFEVADGLRGRLLAGLSDAQVIEMTGLLATMLDRLDQGLPEPEPKSEAGHRA